MGSFSGICHLTGLPIKEDEDVALIFVHYTSIKDPTGLCYVTEDYCTPVSLPVFGKYDGYGRIETPKDTTQVAAQTFLDQINSGLLSSPEIQKILVSENKMALWMSSKYAIFKRENYEWDTEHLEFTSDSEILERWEKIRNGDSSKLFPKEKFETIEDLISVVNNRSLCSIGRDVYRYGYILIKKTALDKVKKGIMATYINEVEDELRKDILGLLDLNLDDDDVRYRASENFTPSNIKSHYLRTFNTSASPFRGISTALQMLVRTVKKSEGKLDRNQYEINIERAIQPTALMGMIINYYDHTNKTFYPRSCTNYKFEIISELNRIIESEINAIKKEREEYYD